MDTASLGHDPNAVQTQVAVPATITSPGVKGTVAYDNNYLYLCVQDNTWRRAQLDLF